MQLGIVNSFLLIFGTLLLGVFTGMTLTIYKNKINNNTRENVLYTIFQSFINFIFLLVLPYVSIIDMFNNWDDLIISVIEKKENKKFNRQEKKRLRKKILKPNIIILSIFSIIYYFSNLDRVIVFLTNERNLVELKIIKNLEKEENEIEKDMIINTKLKKYIFI